MRPPRPTLAVWLSAAGAAALVFAARTREIHLHAGDVPYLDQWKIEGLELLRPWLEDNLGPADFFRPHHEHLPVWTRLLAWLGVVFSGQWDPLLQMTINAALYATGVALMVAWLLRSLDRVGALAGTAVLIALGALPHAWENSTWGFQSQFPLAPLLLFLFAHGSFAHAPGSRRWWIAQAAGLAGLLTLGSMWTAPLAVAAVAAWTAPRDWARWRFAAALAATGLVLMVAVKATTPAVGALALTADSPQNFLALTCIHLGWPLTWPGAAALLYLPLLVLAWRVRGQRETAAFDLIVLTLGAWSALQAAGLGYARGGGYLGFVSRYGDLMAVGVCANFLALWRLTTAHPRGRVALVLAWSAIVLPALVQVSQGGHVEYFHARSASRAEIRRTAVQTYHATRDLAALSTADVRGLLYPAPAEVAEVLDTPGMAKLIPVLTPPGAVGRAVRGVHAHWVWLTAGAVLILVSALVLSLRSATKSAFAPTLAAPPVQPFTSPLWFAAGGVAAFAACWLWPRPWEFRAEHRWGELIYPAGTLPEFSFAFVPPGEFPDGRLIGAAGINGEHLRNAFYGTHVEGPATQCAAESSAFILSAPYLVVPLGGNPRAAQESVFLRIESRDGEPAVILPYDGKNPEDLLFWQLDVRAYAGRSARLVMQDQSSAPDGWVAVATPQLTADASAGARRQRDWHRERTAATRFTPALLALLGATAALWSAIARRRNPAPT